MPELPDFKHVPANIMRQHEHFKRINELTSSLLDIEARHGDDTGNIELNNIWTSLIYAHFNNNMTFMTPYKEKLDNCKYELPDLRSRIHNRIRIIKQRLTEMTPPVQSPAQEYVYGE